MAQLAKNGKYAYADIHGQVAAAACR